jgi:hypothetical protein
MRKKEVNFNGDKLPAFVREAAAAHQRASEKAKNYALKELGAPRKDSTIMSAIENKEVLRFVYSGKPRIVEPQTYGVSIAGREVLRGHQVGGGSASGRSRIAKLFDLAQMSDLGKTGARFSGALPEHNPRDSAMVEVFATLPKPSD